ncbi:MAG: Crp/Fnr family transcriptional regulator [Chitinophagaceae bacterium]|nr:Crp/Fnr family transcriptional regulator [Rubrivivax sp.]
MPRKPSEIDVDALVDALPEPLARLAHRGVAHPYRKGSTLIEEGAVGDTLFIILAGRLRAYSSNLQQDREITYGTYGPGEYVGELGFDGDCRSASVIALEPSVCAVITRATLQAYIAEHPEFAFELLAKVIRRARAATLTARQLALNDVYGRIKLLLEGMAQARTAGAHVDIQRLTHRDIAARVGCSREMVSRVMKDLATGGHVEVMADTLRLRLPMPARW